MKSFLFSILAIAVLILIVTVNGIYVSNVTRKLEDMALDLKSGDVDTLKAIQKYWKKHETIVCFSVSHNDVDDLNIAIEVLIEKSTSSEDDGFYEYKARLLNSIAEMRNKERVHIHNIL